MQYNKQCIICNKDFVSMRRHAKTCSNMCRSRVHSKKHRNKVIIKLCGYCKIEFSCGGQTHAKKYCSKKCRDSNRYIVDKNNLHEQLKKTIRCRVNDALTDRATSYSVVKNLGCSIKELKTYLEDKFTKGMTWDNRGYYGWHIDHIKPLSSFDLTNPEELKKACHYTNLQPLWAEDNLKKGSQCERQCTNCKQSFYSKQYNKKFCSTECQKRHWNLNNKEHKLTLQREWRRNNPDKVLKDSQSLGHSKAVNKWKNKNIEKVRHYNNEFHKRHRQESPQYRIACNIRSRVSKVLQKNIKTGSAIRDLGCSISDLKKHLESQFTEGMSWDNYGSHGWHIDHVKPLSRFNLNNKEQFKEACHYSNLQPLWAEDNLSKGAKYDE